MEVTYIINRKDFIIGNTLFTYMTPVFVIAFALFCLLFTYNDLTAFFSNIGVIEASMGVVVFLVYYIQIALAILIFNTLLSFLNFKLKKGVLGKHIIKIEPEHFFEITDFNETRHDYRSISKLKRVFGYIIIAISGTNAHFIPVKYFESKDAENAFYVDLQNKIKV